MFGLSVYFPDIALAGLWRSQRAYILTTSQGTQTQGLVEDAHVHARACFRGYPAAAWRGRPVRHRDVCGGHIKAMPRMQRLYVKHALAAKKRPRAEPTRVHLRKGTCLTDLTRSRPPRSSLHIPLNISAYVYAPSPYYS